MTRYLLVDDRDGRVLAELASPRQAGLLLSRLEDDSQGGPAVSVVRLDHQEGSLTGVSSTVTMRPLVSVIARQAQGEKPTRSP